MLSSKASGAILRCCRNNSAVGSHQYLAAKNTRELPLPNHNSKIRCFYYSSRTSDGSGNGTGGGNGGTPNKKIPVLKTGFQPTGVNKDGVYMGSTFLMLSPRTLPELDVSSVLDSTVYTRKIGASISGHAAAMRLAKAKRELRDILQQELDGPMQRQQRKEHNKNNGNGRAVAPSTKATPSTTNHNFGDVKKLYLLRRHGVPNQLLQHLLLVADDWLERKAALELWVDSSSRDSLSVITDEGMALRTTWPTEWDNDVGLYLASMKRIVSRLASMTSFCDNCSVEPADLEWKMSISRHNKLPLTLFPNDPAAVFPIVEWVVPVDEDTFNNARRIGKILIRIQGSTTPTIAPLSQDTCLKKSHDVSLIFEANFDVNDEDLQAEGQ